jgi:hypothetical protein
MSSTDVCTAVKDGRRCVLPRFHDASMNATPHEYASLDDPPAADLRALIAKWRSDGYRLDAMSCFTTADHVRQCADELDALLRGVTGATHAE